MARYIDADLLVENIAKIEDLRTLSTKTIGEAINNTPTADVVEVDKVSELIIRKSAEVSDYWQNDVKRYRAMQGYSNIEHDTDNFLRGYNEAVEDMLAILDGAERRDTE